MPKAGEDGGNDEIINRERTNKPFLSLICVENNLIMAWNCLFTCHVGS
jgi:hypothetical protein